jgi:transposase
LESAHFLLVDYLLDWNYQVYVIPSRAVNRYRDRHRQSSSRSDRRDAFILADLLRTDRHRFVPLTADLPLTRKLCSLVRLLSTVKENAGRVSNQLRDLLWRYYPVAAELFSRLDQPLTLAFIQAYPTPQAAQRLTLAEFRAFCRANRYYNSGTITRRYGELMLAKTFASPAVADAYAQQAQSLARVLHFMLQERKAAEKALSQVFQQHPDAFIYASLPGAGEFLQPALLSKFRDSRARFPSASVAQAIAGTCPVTKASGKYKHVAFRWACDREFRNVATQFARCSISESPWAAAYYHSVRPRVKTESQAFRRLANRWISIIWRLWVDRVTYDEEVHLQNCFAYRSRS